MTKQELKNALKLIDSMGKLLETGLFPGHKSGQVLDALRYIHIMRQEFHAQFKDSRDDKASGSESITEAPSEAVISDTEAKR